MVKKYGELFLEARRALLPGEGDNAALYARLLLCKLCGKSMAQLISDRELYASEQIEQQMNRALREMADGKPLAYILGTWSFYGMELVVTPDVLIPRDDTMAVTELAIRRLRTMPATPRVLDLCTGSGCIGLAIAREVPSARLTLADCSAPALSVARQNVHNNKLSARVNCLPGDAFQPAPAFWGKFDLIVCNPPYVTSQQMQELSPSVKNYEPHLALDGGEDGLLFYRAIAKNYLHTIRPGGWLCMEFGTGQELAVGRILQEAGFAEIGFTRDLRGVIRAVSAQNPKI